MRWRTATSLLLVSLNVVLNTLRSLKTRCTFSLPLELLTGAIFLVADILLADSELRAVPLHLTSVGRKGDPAARALFAAALKQPVTYKRVEWWDRSEGGVAKFRCPVSGIGTGCRIPLHRPQLFATDFLAR